MPEALLGRVFGDDGFLPCRAATFEARWVHIPHPEARVRGDDAETEDERAIARRIYREFVLPMRRQYRTWFGMLGMMLAAFATSWSFVARTPRSRYRLSSNPTRTLPPERTAAATKGMSNREGRKDPAVRHIIDHRH